MTEFIADYSLFTAKLLTFGIVAIIVLGVGAAIVGRSRRAAEGELEVRRLNDRYRDLQEAMLQTVLHADEIKRHQKDRRKTEKTEKKQRKEAAKTGESIESKRVFVLDFHGDLRASAVANLREEISIVLRLATPADEVVLRLESHGGLVNAYGLAASQLARLRDAKIPLTVCVDKIAASGGYMMAVVGNRILAAPFAVIGSIGVVAQLPNFHRLLKRHDIDYELLTAGEYKRTLTLFGENTEEGRRKFTEDLEETHLLFKQFIMEYRQGIEIESVSTGEIWFGKRALEQQLIDALETSDSYLQRCMSEAEVFHLRYREKKKLGEKLGLWFENTTHRMGFRKLSPDPADIARSWLS